MDDDAILNKLRLFEAERHEGQRAPHKALLLLLALGRIHNPPRLFPYHEWAEELNFLLRKYGHPLWQPNTKSPFCRLHKTDGLWDIPGYGNLERHWPTDRDLRDANVSGGFPERIYGAFCGNPQLIAKAATLLLRKQTSLPQELYAEVLEDAGLRGVMLVETLEPLRAEVLCEPSDAGARRAPFDAEVLRAYHNCCAVCSYDIRMDDSPLGLQAAHIHFSDRGGPDEVANGLALCPVHRKALETGGISLSNDYGLLVSPRLQGKKPDLWFLPYASKPIAMPEREENRPALEYIQWHRAEVWQG